MFKLLKKTIKESLFKPNIISFIINPSYFMRKGLYKWIQNNKKYITGKILDFWCWQKPYKKLFDYKQYVWLDIQESWHDHINENIDVYYDWKKIPFEDECFDAILASEVFEHTFNIDIVLSELHRTLKKNGNILITIPFVIWEHEVPYDFGRYTSFWIRHLLEKHGFTVEKIEKRWTHIETIFQLTNFYIFNLFWSCNNIIKWILSLIFIFPVNLLWTIFSAILPNKWDTYMSLIILAKK